MNRLILASIALTLCACKQSDSPPPAATPPAAPPPAAPAPTPAPPPAPVPAPPPAAAAACDLVVAIAPGTLTWNGGGVKGMSPWHAGDKPNLDALKPIVTTCHNGLVTFDKAVAYQDVISVMDALIQVGISAIDLGSPGDKPDATPPPRTDHRSEWTVEQHYGSNGELSLTGTHNDDSTKLKQAPVLIITKTQVLLKTTVIGKPGDADLQTKIAAALPPKPSDPTLILQADAATGGATITAAIGAAKASGYDNLLFAVKNR